METLDYIIWKTKHILCHNFKQGTITTKNERKQREAQIFNVYANFSICKYISLLLLKITLYRH